MALAQSTDGRHPGGFQLSEGKEEEQQGRAAFVAKDKKGRRLVEKHRKYWCSPRYYNADAPSRYDVTLCRPPSTVIDEEAHFTHESMCYLAAWRIATNKGNDEFKELALNVLSQHCQSMMPKVQEIEVKKDKSPIPSSDDALYDYVKKNNIHLNKVITKKVSRAMHAREEIDKATYKAIRNGECKLRCYNGVFSFLWKSAVVATTFATVVSASSPSSAEIYHGNLNLARLAFSAFTIYAVRRSTQKLALMLALVLLIGSAIRGEAKGGTIDLEVARLEDEIFRGYITLDEARTIYSPRGELASKPASGECRMPWTHDKPRITSGEYGGDPVKNAEAYKKDILEFTAKLREDLRSDSINIDRVLQITSAPSWEKVVPMCSHQHRRYTARG